ncbi:proteasome assembly chaperone family protein [Candidatus Bathyarchaeota archaeon]|nr:MAG: proteasome assembly chaperone family protein [Candidatus Bathyarchaeota archaeon]RLI17503.1 MAG: proteasome assembly chaperone family protein [Candidatus Bathyarchaeota archaeon]HDD70386.1 proteasome assembly chaperone family protein [Candidatus Bathyarchaeota archaeon]
MSEEVKIIEKKEIPSGAVMIFGFPDVGLVGVIAASHLISELNDLEEVAYMESKLLPPLIVLHEGLPHSPIRIFGNREILLAVSETAIPADALYAIMYALIDWGKKKNVKMMISLSGIPVQNRQDIEELKVFAAASSPEILKMLQDKGIEILREGYMVGPQAIMLQKCAQLGLPALTLLAQCFLNYPDPEAAAEILKQLTNIAGIKVDVSKLLEKGEEIRLRARDIMRRTQQELTKMKKTQEYDIPLYVS